MVNFTNNKVEGNYIYATAVFGGVHRNVKIHVTKEECIMNGSRDDEAAYWIIKAAWCLQYELKHRGKLRKMESIAWG